MEESNDEKLIAQAQEEFPFLAEVTNNDVNIRAGQAVSFESLGQVAKGANLIVVGKEYDWYKIKLPDTFRCFISGKYLHVHSGNIGEILGSHVNVRARAGENFTVLGRLARGTLVRITNKTGEWYEIEPLEGIYGWVSQDFVKFKSKAVPASQTVQITSHNIYAKKKAIEGEATALAKKEVQKTKKNVFSVSGRVQEVDDNDFCQEFRYKLVAGETVRYFLRAPDHILTQFSPYQVKIEGELSTENKQYSQPVINVTRIIFIL